MPNISDPKLHAIFRKRLLACEVAPVWMFDDWEKDFLISLRDNLQSREDAVDLGLTAWNPSVSQWNTLGMMYEKAS